MSGRTMKVMNTLRGSLTRSNDEPSLEQWQSDVPILRLALHRQPFLDHMDDCGRALPKPFTEPEGAEAYWASMEAGTGVNASQFLDYDADRSQAIDFDGMPKGS